MTNWLSELATLAESEAPFEGAACSCHGRAEEVLIIERVPIGEKGDHFEVKIPAVKCLECDTAWPDVRAEKIRHAAACWHLGILDPAEVKNVRDSLGMTRKVFGEAFGIPHASMERWENGRLHQNRSMDTLLRALMIPGVAQALDRRAPPPIEPDSNVIPFPTLGNKPRPDFENALIRKANFQMQMCN